MPMIIKMIIEHDKIEVELERAKKIIEVQAKEIEELKKKTAKK